MERMFRWWMIHSLSHTESCLDDDDVGGGYASGATTTNQRMNRRVLQPSSSDWYTHTRCQPNLGLFVYSTKHQNSTTYVDSSSRKLASEPIAILPPEQVGEYPHFTLWLQPRWRPRWLRNHHPMVVVGNNNCKYWLKEDLSRESRLWCANVFGGRLLASQENCAQEKSQSNRKTGEPKTIDQTSAAACTPILTKVNVFPIFITASAKFSHHLCSFFWSTESNQH